MRKGWKTRIDERTYFENKRYEREERQQMIALIKNEDGSRDVFGCCQDVSGGKVQA